MKEIDELVAQGFKVKVSHLREAKPKEVEDEIHILTTQMSVYALRLRGYEPDSLGGSTVVRLVTPNGVEFREVVETSQLDHYTKRIGVAIGLGRLLKGQVVAINEAASMELTFQPPQPS